MSDAISLATIKGLPAPEIIETLDYEVIYEALRADAQARFDAAGITYTVGELDTDPVQIVLQASASRELLLRARANDVARADLIAFSWRSNLDHIAAKFDVVRLPDETDEGLRGRTALAIAGRSPGGTEERYRAVARAADVRVAETAIYQVDGGPQLELAVLATDNNGVPDQTLLDAVEAAVTAKDVLLVGDAIRVVSAVKVEVDVSVDVWLLPTGDAALLDRMESLLMEAWTSEGGIGFDLNPSWITSRLHLAGVSRVVPTNPAAPVVAAPNHAIAIQSVTVTFKGRQR
jgi:phage-related baseplate assembly protein